LLSKVRAAGVRRQSRIRSQLKPDEKPADFERRYRYFPVTDGDGDLMPTRLGNILRAAEAYPSADGRYGLDAVFWWPRLFAVVPDKARSDLSSTRASMALLLNVCTLSAFLAVSSLAAGITVATTGPGCFWGFWAATVATGVLALTAHRGALGPALIYADLLRSAFDLYRGDLLSKLGFALPDTLAAERLLWSSLQSVLYRGATSEEGELALDEARKRYVSHPAGNK
jgi:hypothetical protein